MKEDGDGEEKKCSTTYSWQTSLAIARARVARVTIQKNSAAETRFALLIHASESGM